MQALFALTLFCSAALLFVVQPMFAKMVLPRLGGTPSVWNTCMVFYQTVLLLGYLYAHFATKLLGPRRQAVLHVAVLALPWLVLPIAVPAGWVPPMQSNPTAALLVLLGVAVGLPFFVVSASAPLLQTWFAQTGDRSAHDPYFLYAASNLGSLLGLFGYPLLIEPRLTLSEQGQFWTAGFGVLAVMTALCAAVLWRSRPALVPQGGLEPAPAVPDAPPTMGRRLRWLALALAPSSLLLGVTTHIVTDIASVPLLWVIPLGLYLLSFVLVFARRPPLPHRWMVRIEPFFVLTLAAWFCLTSARINWMILPLHLATFFMIAMVCHGELVASRPGTRYLTEFYLWMSLGGMLGGLFNAIVAPLVFGSVLEYPLMILVACLLRPVAAAAGNPRRARIFDLLFPLVLLMAGMAAVWVTSQVMRWRGQPGEIPLMAGGVILGVGAVLALSFVQRPWRFGLGVTAVMLLGAAVMPDGGNVIFSKRSFFGLVRVRQDAGDETNTLVHGSTNHGSQSYVSELRRIPRTYYHRSGPLGQTFAALEANGPLGEVGVIGLGTGTVAAYAKPGGHMTFYEIDPTVAGLAHDPRYFTYLSDAADSGAKLEVVLGDARLQLAAAPAHGYDLLVLDAYSSDAIPIHLITREALELYLSKLQPGGIMALHISNRYLDLAPVLGRICGELHLAGLVQDDNDMGRDEQTREQYQREGKSRSEWVLVAEKPKAFLGLLFDRRWQTLPASPEAPLWTDDFSNIVSVLTVRQAVGKAITRLWHQVAGG